MQLYLGGHLDYYGPQKQNPLTIPLPQPARLNDVLAGLDVPLAEIAICVVNGTAIFSFEAAIVSDEDDVALYPHVGGG